MRKLKIAQLSTPFISVPPEGYGGIERVVDYLTEGLIKRGHEVTLLAPGDSETSAKLVSPFSKALDKEETEKLFSPLAIKLFWLHSLPSLYHAVIGFERASEFDIIHNHFHYLGLFFGSLVKTPTVHTYHGDLSSAVKSPIERMILEKYKESFWTAISESQKRTCPVKLNFIKVVYNSIPLEKFSWSKEPGDYLVWLGRITPKKGVTQAIEVAKRLGMKLVIAGVVNPRDRQFFEKEIKPKIDNRQIVSIGAVDHEKKVKFLKKAFALLYPVTWEEPFGLVMIESMACGTPVVAYANGAVPEIVRDGVTGFVVESALRSGRIFSCSATRSGINASSSIESSSLARKRTSKKLSLPAPSLGKNWRIKKRGVEGLVEAIKEIKKLSKGEIKKLRTNCRKHVEKNFSVGKMVEQYESVYYKVLGVNSRPQKKIRDRRRISDS